MLFYTLNIVVNLSDGTLDIESIQDEEQNYILSVNIDKNSFDCIRCNQKYFLNALNYEKRSALEVVEDDGSTPKDEELEILIPIKEVKNDSEILDIVKGSQNKRKNFKCQSCGLSFSYKSVLKSHRCLKESNINSNLHCSKCNSNFTDEEVFQQHLKTRHSKDKKSLVCHLCGVLFSKRSRLSYHINHSRTHNQLQQTPLTLSYECHYCSKKFPSKYTILRHIKRHFPSLKKPEELIFCKECGKSFKKQRNLKRHLQIVHDGQKPYHCILCEKRFTSANYLKIHMGHHEGNVKYPCHFCHLTYRDPGTVSNHMRKFHGKEYENYKNSKKLIVCE